ncbi:MAG: hypothetical protein AAGU11_17385, partial [Syntrophobacteraceae bacterium]
MNEKKRLNILILDPERDTAELFMRALETHSGNFKCYWVKTSEEALSILGEMSFAVLLADFSLLEKDHFLLVDTIRDTSIKLVFGGYL